MRYLCTNGGTQNFIRQQTGAQHAPCVVHSILLSVSDFKGLTWLGVLKYH